MKDPNRKLIILLWIVVAVLVVGSVIGGLMLVHKTDDLNSTNSSLSDDNAHLRSQLQNAQASASASPTPSLTPDATPEPSASVTPAPNPASVTPTPQPPKH